VNDPATWDVIWKVIGAIVAIACTLWWCISMYRMGVEHGFERGMLHGEHRGKKLARKEYARRLEAENADLTRAEDFAARILAIAMEVRSEIDAATEGRRTARKQGEP
jgi:hypothetical protein